MSFTTGPNVLIVVVMPVEPRPAPIAIAIVEIHSYLMIVPSTVSVAADARKKLEEVPITFRTTSDPCPTVSSAEVS